MDDPWFKIWCAIVGTICLTFFVTMAIVGYHFIAKAW